MRPISILGIFWKLIRLLCLYFQKLKKYIFLPVVRSSPAACWLNSWLSDDECLLKHKCKFSWHVSLFGSFSMQSTGLGCKCGIKLGFLTITEDLVWIQRIRFLLKGTVSATSSSNYKEHVRFTTVPFKPLSGQQRGRYPHLHSWRLSARLEVRVYTVLCVLVYTRTVSCHLISLYINKNIYEVLDQANI